jgi:4-hydroxy-tetrahydrodipicolinate reductase
MTGAGATSVAIYGAGQLGTAVAELLRANSRYEVRGPFGRAARDQALAGGADLVIIATTTRLRDVAADIETAAAAGSNVLVSAEEAAFPFVVDEALARRLDALARERGVSIAGAGVNPGLMFDSLVLTLLGAAPRGCTIHVRRNVDISGFGSTVLRRIGVGSTAEDFAAAVERGDILGHAGFPQSMAIVADAIGVTISRIDKVLRPVVASEPIDVPGRFRIDAGQSAGVDQTYTAIVDGSAWFVAHFFGHVALRGTGREPSDDIDLTFKRKPFQSLKLRPGTDAQVGSRNMVANSVERVLAARPGWVTVAEMMPAYPAPTAPTQESRQPR